MPENKVGRGLLVILVGGAVLIGSAGGLVAGRWLVRSRPTCANAVNSYFDAMPERQRELFEGMQQFGRATYVQACREGRWSGTMKSCWVKASSAAAIDACPNEWLNAGAICAQLQEAAAAVTRRCRKELPSVDCGSVKSIGLGMQWCLESLRDVACDEIETVKEACDGALPRAQ